MCDIRCDPRSLGFTWDGTLLCCRVGLHLQLGAAVLHVGDHLLQGGQHEEGAAAAAAQARAAAAGAAAVEAVVAAAQAVAAAVGGKAVRAAQAVVLANDGLSMMGDTQGW